MSLILDALRRAESERQRGQSPDLNRVLQADTARGTRPVHRRWAWALAALLLAAGIGGGWLWSRMTPTAVQAPLAASTASAVPTQPPPRAPVATSVPGAAVVSVAPPVTPTSATAARGAAPAARPMATPSRKASTQPPTASTAKPDPAPAAPPEVISLSTLAEPQRSAVMRLAIGGGVHSQDRAQSFVLVGGQLTREGDALAPGIAVERIEPRAVVLRVGEQRVRVPL